MAWKRRRRTKAGIRKRANWKLIVLNWYALIVSIHWAAGCLVFKSCINVYSSSCPCLPRRSCDSTGGVRETVYQFQPAFAIIIIIIGIRHYVTVSGFVIHAVGKAAPLMSAFSASPERRFPSLSPSLLWCVWIVSVGGGKPLIPWHLHIYSSGCSAGGLARKTSRLRRWRAPLSVEPCRTIAIRGPDDGGVELKNVSPPLNEWHGDGFRRLRHEMPCIATS